MTRISMKVIREWSKEELRKRMQESRNELVKLKVDGSQGTLRKKSGNLRPKRRDIARMMTRVNEMKKK